MKLSNIAKLAITLAASGLAAVIGGFFTSASLSSWYVHLAKPGFTPPDWIFGPVWTLLYILMAVAAWLVWRQGLNNRDAKMALGIFFFQLGLNALWPILFFGAQNPGVAFMEIVSLWCAILAMSLAFYHISRPAFFLIIPYLLWVSFAGFLNYSIWQMSGGSMNRVFVQSELSLSPVDSDTVYNPVNGIDENQVFCAMDVAICSDGSYVGRVAPVCDFAPCPDGSPAMSETPGYMIDNGGETYDEDQVFCAMDVAVCPDGSYVSRVAPSCDFAPCPNGGQAMPEMPEYMIDEREIADDEDMVFCTMDAKICPDGSYVGRIAPSCDFAPCP